MFHQIHQIHQLDKGGGDYSQSFLTILTEKKLQIDPKWSETRKKHKIGETEFFTVAGAGG